MPTDPPPDTLVCSSCAAICAPGSRFCAACGTPFVAEDDLLPSRERKIVTTLFCDLVGFTRLSENADPEDIDRLLQDYAAVASHAVEIHGGIVEKFIGDAVVAVFGVPNAHEDDAERAVHAALRIRRDLSTVLGPDGAAISVRIGVNTGEALARLDAAARFGEGFLAGDAVNTAARLQSAAPPGGILVGSTTYALTSRLFRYEELDPVALKGKTQAVPVWLAQEAVSRTGADRAADFSTIFVGRQEDLARLDALFDDAVQQDCVRMALVTGEPGIGKSRLLAEFFHLLDSRPREITWRQGRCLPYGEGIAFWPVGEIVKAQAGILETDGVETTELKLARALSEGPDRLWLQDRLRPLIGLKAPTASQEESFSAWNRFIEQLAERRPLVLVVEDLHWADDALLEFLRQLAAHDRRMPLFLVLTARTHFLDDRPAFAASVAPEGRISLAPLSELQIRELLAGLVEDETVLDRLGASIAERGGGNPLYSEELLRLLKERGLLGTYLEERVAVALPHSLQAVIAARIDALPPRHKEYLTDAAVVGRRFWDGAVAALAGDGEALEEGLRRLAAAELIRDSSSSSMAGQREFVFWHALTRDVAYNQLTRDARAEKHERLAHWIEEQAGGRGGDLNDALAHHYVTALETRRELRDETAANRLIDPAARHLIEAGDRAAALDLTSAARYFRKARDVVPRRHALRPRAELMLGKALALMGSRDEAHQVLEDAIAGFTSLGSTRDVALAMSELSMLAWHMDGDRRSEAISASALQLLQNDEPSPELITVLETRAGVNARHFDSPGVIAMADRAIQLAADMALDPPVRALHYRALARCDLGEAAALEEFRQALEAAKRIGTSDVGVMSYNLVQDVLAYEGPRSAMRVIEEWREFAARRGDMYTVLAHQSRMAWCLFHAGEWHWAEALAAELDGELERKGMSLDLEDHRSLWAQILTMQGDTRRAAPLAEWSEKRSRERSGNRIDCLIALAGVRLAQGDREACLALLEEFDAGVPRPRPIPFALLTPSATRIAAAAGDLALASTSLEGLVATRAFDDRAMRSGEALLAELAGDLAKAEPGYADAASRWQKLDEPWEAAQALLGQGRCLVALGRAREAATVLGEARATFAELRARPTLEETERLLSRLP